MKWSTFKLRFKRAAICSWKGHEFDRIDDHGHILPIFWCDRCGALSKDIYIPALDKTLKNQPRIVQKAPFEPDKFGTYTIISLKKFMKIFNARKKEGAAPPMPILPASAIKRDKALEDSMARRGEVWDTLQHKFTRREVDK